MIDHPQPESRAAASAARAAASWLAVDWGSSRLRVWAMGPDDRPAAHASADRGMGALAPDDFEPALLALVEPWLTTGASVPVLVCGMAGAREGWAQADYAPQGTPIVDYPLEPARPRTDSRLDVRILRGLRQDEPADVMRGEETQIAGLMAIAPAFRGLVCLPGTHGKWALVGNGAVASFRTVLTGEMFDLLANRSILRHGLDPRAGDDAAFDGGVKDVLSAPTSAPALLFGVRANSILNGLSPAAAGARLSGLLIGAEIAATLDLGAPGDPVVIVGAAALAERYARALALAGRSATILSGEEAVLSGLVAARRRLFRSPN
ncbi:MAG: 2-dehydro-3-deoxygalactonokinase [Rubrimonas sp.]